MDSLADERSVGDAAEGDSIVNGTEEMVDVTVPLHAVGRRLERSTSSDYPDNQQKQKLQQRNSSTLRMPDVGLLMREQDAEILESIHQNGGPNQTGTTPVLSSRALPPESLLSDNKMPPPLSLAQDNGKSLSESNGDAERLKKVFDDQSTSPNLKQRNQLLPFLMPTNHGIVARSLLGTRISSNSELAEESAKTDFGTTPESAQPGECSHSDGAIYRIEESVSVTSMKVEKVSSRRMLSGEVYQEEIIRTDDNRSSPASTAGKVYAIDEGCVDNLNNVVDVESSHILKRCESKERRLNEAAQFAEAVGDLPLTEQKDMRIIDYGDDEQAMIDDDDDDDATEVHIQKRLTGAMIAKRVVVPHGSSLPANIPDPATSSSTPESLPLASLATPPSAGPETPIKTRPQWPTEQFHHRHTFSLRSSSDDRNPQSGFLAQLPSSLPSASNDFVYKGIRANPPDIVKRGTTRGNYALLHRKAWLEVSDKYHRYGKNLRLYYRHWESLGCPTNMFFDWLDSKGEAAGQPLPELGECPRSQLDSDTVLYITNQDVTQGYAVRFVVEDKENESTRADDNHGQEPEKLCRGRVVDVDGDPVCTGPDGWIFVLRDNVMYGAQKITSVSGQSKQRFHHSSFFGGKAVAAAGIFITDDDGYLTKLYPHSGHYRPGEAHMQRVLFYLYHEGVDLRTFEIDTQQIEHVAREGEAVTKDKEKKNTANAEGKKKKIESLHLMPAVLVACFLAHKARFIGEGIFSAIHQIRKTDVTSVTEALMAIDNGGVRVNKNVVSMGHGAQ